MTSSAAVYSSTSKSSKYSSTSSIFIKSASCILCDSRRQYSTGCSETSMYFKAASIVLSFENSRIFAILSASFLALARCLLSGCSDDSRRVLEAGVVVLGGLLFTSSSLLLFVVFIAAPSFCLLISSTLLFKMPTFVTFSLSVEVILLFFLILRSFHTSSIPSASLQSILFVGSRSSIPRRRTCNGLEPFSFARRFFTAAIAALSRSVLRGLCKVSINTTPVDQTSHL
mmetsp:Transcript_11391/g.15767  ORF Transcript_11391/g.15767 Transcript_11391/m.15767 type:complete len:228 (-) Transcript_11391:20-703(-)